jgi:hypothetical protein
MIPVSVMLLRASLLYFGTGFTFGALLLANKGFAFAPFLWRLLPVHIEWLMIGWMVQLAMGVAVWIAPRYSDKPRYGTLKFAWGAFFALNTGILGVCFGYLVPNGEMLVMVGRVQEAGAGVLFLLHLWGRIKPLSIPKNTVRSSSHA